MPYIGGRGPDYTTKLNLMYNLRGAVAVEGSRGETPGPVESEAGDGRRRPRRGRGTTLTRVSSVGREGRGQVETRGDGAAAEAVRKVIDIPLQMLRGESSEGSRRHT